MPASVFDAGALAGITRSSEEGWILDCEDKEDGADVSDAR